MRLTSKAYSQISPVTQGRLFGYLALPRKPFTAQIPAIVVIHENRGLNDHIKDVTRRFARAGYVALGVDLLFRQGGTERFPDPADASRAYNNVTANGALADLKSGVAYLRTLWIVKANHIGCFGFCAGGRPFLQPRSEPARSDCGGGLLRSATRAAGSVRQNEPGSADALRAAR